MSAALTISDSNITGSGTQAAPYTGGADYSKTTATPGTVTVDAPVTVTVDGTAGVPVYQIGTSGTYIAIQTTEAGNVYYAVTKDSSGDYIVGAELAYSTELSFSKGGISYTLPEGTTVASVGTTGDKYVAPLTCTIGGTDYTQYVGIAGTMTGVTSVTRYISKNDSTFYAYTDGMISLPAPADASGLTMAYLYYASATQYLVSLMGEDEQFYLITIGSSNTSELITQTTTATLKNGEAVVATDPVFVTETKEISVPTTTYTSENMSGTPLTLTVNTTREGTSTSAANANYIIRFVNRTTGSEYTVEGVTNASGVGTAN